MGGAPPTLNLLLTLCCFDPGGGAPGRAACLVIRPHPLKRPELEFRGPSQGDRLAVSPGFINAITGTQKTGFSAAELSAICAAMTCG